MATADSSAGDPRRRMVRRRAGMAFSGGGLSSSSSGSSVADTDDDLEAAPADLNGEVLSRAVATPLPPPEEPDLTQLDPHDDDYTPSNRLSSVRARSSEYEREYRLQLLHRLLMRNLPLDEIATSLGVSVSTVLRDRKELTERLRAAAKELDIDVMVGNSKGFYEEVQAMAMRAASNRNTPMPMKLAAMRTALASHNDMHRFFQAAGVYDVLRFRRGASEGQVSDIQRLMALTDELLSDAKRETRSGGNPLGGFSGGDSENMSL